MPVAGKTGTTDDFADAWFVGYTPKYSTAVWVGYPNAIGTARMYSVHGIAVAGGTFPAAIWPDFMREVVARDGGSGSFPLPNDPVSWSPFSSDFTRSAGLANSARSASSSSSASTGSTSSVPRTRLLLPQPPAPSSPPASPSPSPSPRAEPGRARARSVADARADPARGARPDATAHPAAAPRHRRPPAPPPNP